MKKFFVTCLIFSTPLYSSDIGGIDFSLTQFYQMPTKDQRDFNVKSIGIGFRVADPERASNAFRLSFEKGFQAAGYSPDSIASIDNYYSLSGDYLWNYPKKIFLGAGVRLITYEIIAPPPSPYPSMSSIKYGKNNSVLPQFIVGWHIVNHFSVELDTSLIQNSLQFRFSF